MGLSCSKVARRISPALRCSPARSKASVTPCQFIAMAATYQITMTASTTTRTGPVLPCHRREGFCLAWRTGKVSASVVIGMPGSQTLADPVCDPKEFGCLTDFQPAVAPQNAGINDVDDASRTRRHDNDLRGEEH